MICRRQALSKEELYNFYVENNHEAIKFYKKYLNEWINNNFMYFMPDDLRIYMPNIQVWPYDPYNKFNNYIIKLDLHNKIYSNQKEKNEFFIDISEKILNDIKEILLKFNENTKNRILSYFYSILLCNRKLSLNIIEFQKEKKCLDEDDKILKSLCAIMTQNSIFNTNIENDTTEIEQFIATQGEAIELLIKIIQSEHYTSIGSLKLTDLILRELILLSHALVLAINTRQALTQGINKMAVVEVNNEGIVYSSNAVEFNNINVSNYNYRFNMDSDEYNEQLFIELDYEIFYKYGFHLYDVYTLKDTFNINNEIMIADKNKYLNMIKEIGIGKERAESLFEYFSFNFDNNESILAEELYKYQNSEKYNMLSQRIFINLDECNFICYRFFIKYATDFFISSVFNSPHKYVKHTEVANKVTNSFVKSVEKILKDAFPDSITTTNFYCSSDREIDVIFILKNKIYLIECKRLSFPETNNSMLNMCKRLAKEYIEQLDEEIKNFKNNIEEIFNKFNTDKLINIKNTKKYEIRGLIVTKEFSVVHIQKTKYPILIKNELIEYINNNIKN
jgi:hypothetical protein